MDKARRKLFGLKPSSPKATENINPQKTQKTSESKTVSFQGATQHRDVSQSEQTLNNTLKGIKEREAKAQKASSLIKDMNALAQEIQSKGLSQTKGVGGIDFEASLEILGEYIDYAKQPDADLGKVEAFIDELKFYTNMAQESFMSTDSGVMDLSSDNMSISSSAGSDSVASSIDSDDDDISISSSTASYQNNQATDMAKLGKRLDDILTALVRGVLKDAQEGKSNDDITGLLKKARVLYLKFAELAKIDNQLACIGAESVIDVFENNPSTAEAHAETEAARINEKIASLKVGIKQLGEEIKQLKEIVEQLQDPEFKEVTVYPDPKNPEKPETRYKADNDLFQIEIELTSTRYIATIITRTIGSLEIIEQKEKKQELANLPLASKKLSEKINSMKKSKEDEMVKLKQAIDENKAKLNETEQTKAQYSDLSASQKLELVDRYQNILEKYLPKKASGELLEGAKYSDKGAEALNNLLMEFESLLTSYTQWTRTMGNIENLAEEHFSN